MFTHLITLALGFAAGCTFKELLDKGSLKSKLNKKPYHMPQPSTHLKSPAEENVINYPSTGFSLQSLKKTFDLYNVQPLNAGSFGILLRQIRNSCYKDILKHILENANTPEKLVDMLKSQTIPNKDFEIDDSMGIPYITIDKINNYISDEGIAISEFKTNTEKVKFLLSLYYAKGIDDFKQTIGSNMSDILSAYERGDNLTDIYNDIISLVKKRYDYLS